MHRLAGLALNLWNSQGETHRGLPTNGKKQYQDHRGAVGFKSGPCGGDGGTKGSRRQPFENKVALSKELGKKPRPAGAG